MLYTSIILLLGLLSLSSIEIYISQMRASTHVTYLNNIINGREIRDNANMSKCKSGLPTLYVDTDGVLLANEYNLAEDAANFIKFAVIQCSTELLEVRRGLFMRSLINSLEFICG